MPCIGCHIISIFAESLDKHRRGRQLAILRNFASIVLIAVPTIAGFVIAGFGFSFIFLFSVFAMCVSLIPLWFMGNTYERYSWGYIETFQHLFARGNRQLMLAHGANGSTGVNDWYYLASIRVSPSLMSGLPYWVSLHRLRYL